jgi:hypothetical protein
MTKKVNLAIFDKDLKARTVGKFEVTDDGSKIRVRAHGKRNFNPTFDNESFIEFPHRSLVPPFSIRWKKIYFVRNGANACVNFKTETVPELDQETVDKAAEAKILEKMGNEKQETPFTTYLIILILVGIALKVFGVI